MRLTGKIPPSGRAINTVLSILRSSPNGISTQEIYKRATPKVLPQGSIEAMEENPLQSMRYLKRTVLATLQEKGTIEKFHKARELPTAEEIQAVKTPKKKKAMTLPKHAWYWKLHSWEESVARAEGIRAERVERKEKKATEASSPPKATA